MLVYEEQKQRLCAYEEELADLKDALNLQEVNAEIAKLEEVASKDGFWDDAQNSQKVLKKTSSLKSVVKGYEDLVSLYEDTLVLIDMADEENDESLAQEVIASVDKFISEYDSMRLSTLLSGEYDSNNAILTFHAGAGGTEAQDWVEMLFRMYTRWGERHGFSVKTLDFLDGDDAGLKSAVVLVEGVNAYGYLLLLKLCLKLMMIFKSTSIQMILE